MKSPFDLVVLTAANEKQAKGYLAQLSWRKKMHLLPEMTDFKVIADPQGKRIGSGASTLYVLDQLSKSHNDPVQAFTQKRILVIHSGGDSKRIPAFSATGKIFAPLPTEQFFSLFDIMLDNYSQLPVVGSGQVLVTSGDVLLNFDAKSIQFHETDITGVGYAEDAKAASGYGVYVVDPVQQDQMPVPVKNFLQKPTGNMLAEAGAIDRGNRTWIDTGIINFPLATIQILLQCRELLTRIHHAQLEINLYHEFLFAIMAKTRLPDSEKLQKIGFYVSLLPYCGFFHVGKTREFLENFYTVTHAGTVYNFNSYTRSNAANFPNLRSAIVYNSVINSPQVECSAPALVERCEIDAPLTLKGENILTGLKSMKAGLLLDKGDCLTILPLENGKWVAMMYGIDDHMKKGSLFLNCDMDEFCRNRNIEAHDLWEDNAFQYDPWHAKWFVVDNDPWQAVQKMRSLRDNRDLETWQQSLRISMSEILKETDHDQIMLHMDRVLKKIRLCRVGYELSKREWTHQELLDWCSDETERRQLGSDLLNLARQEKNLARQARLYYLHSTVAKNSDKSFEIIRKAVAYGIRQPEKQIGLDGYQIRTDQVVWVTVPARLDFAGGWSDTPPYCMDHGGVVLNASVKLNGQYPIQAIAKRCQEPIIRINSIDLGRSVILQHMHELMDFAQPGQWESLAKAAFIAAGIFPEKDDSDLKNVLKNWGGGMELTLFSALPAGSGLGTSSILGSAVIACLARVFGQHLLAQDLFSRTSYMEQLLTTGGGWQDQIGGVAGGVKLIVTQKGFDQSPTLSWTQLFTDGPEGERFLLYYTGIRRMAQNILQKIVGRYLDRDKEAITAIENLKSLALDMKDDLDRRRIDAFGGKIDRVWHYNKLLDVGSTTPEIENILTNIKDHVLGAKLLGAGGGGFLFIVAKDIESSYKIRSILESRPTNDRARFFDFDIDHHGLEISVM